MHSFLEVALINAVVIVPLALVAEVASRVFRRPALTHLLWVLILVKLVTPPVVHIPLVDHEWLASVGHQFVPPIFVDGGGFVEFDPFEELKRVKNSPHIETNDIESTIVLKSASRPHTLADQNKKLAVRRNSLLAITNNWIRNRILPDFLISGLMIAWALGGIAWFLVQGYRCVRFRRILTTGTAAPPELQHFSDQLAKRLGLARSPTVWIMPGVMSPMLWGNGHSTLLIFPEQLLDRLDCESTGTLLTHELAHYRRRDHWVRIVALMATGFFWWHPVVWWARHQIETVEEECCDALVVKVLTTPPKRYAEAILETVDFLAEFQFRLPPLATGLSQFPFLRQRLTWIMRGPRRQDFGYCGRVLLLILACNLPLQPTWLAARAPKPVADSESTNTPSSLESTPSESPGSDSDATTHSGGIASAPIGRALEDPVIPSRWFGLDIRSHSNDNRFVVLGDKSTHILLDLETGRDFDLTPFDITAIAFSPNTNQFVTIDGDRFLRLWDAENCDVVQTWQVPGGQSKSVDISFNARWIVTGGRDGIVRIWSLTSQRPFRELPRELSRVNCVRFSPDGHLLAVATGDWMSPQTGRIALFDVGSWSERISMNWNSPAAAVAFRADGQSLNSGDWQGRIARWSIETGELMGFTNAPKDMLVADEFSPNGSPLVDIDIPDLNVDINWGDKTPSAKPPWFFNRWPLVSPAAIASPAGNTASGKPVQQ